MELVYIRKYLRKRDYVNKKIKKLVSLLGALLVFLLLAACSSGTGNDSSNDESISDEETAAKDAEGTTGDYEFTSFEDAVESAKGKTVSFYGFGGSEKANLWVDEVVAPAMEAKYDIKVKRVPMNIEDIMNKLLTEKEAGSSEGDIDVIWINGENFFTAKQADLLYGPIQDKVPSFEELMAVDGPNSLYDFGVEIEGYEVPYGTAQLTFVGNTDAFKEGFPTSAAGLMTYAQANPGRITYTALPEFTGSAFVRNIIVDIVGFEALNAAPAEKEALYQVIKPGLDYLNAIEPYLWQEGKAYPATTAELDQMFADGQIDMTYSYSQMHAAQKRTDNEFPETAESFLFDNGTISNQSYLAIAGNSSVKDAALVLINEMTSEEAQLQKAQPKYGFALPPFDSGKMSAETNNQLAAIYKNQGVLSVEELQSKQIPEIQAEKIPIIEELWQEHVLHD